MTGHGNVLILVVPQKGTTMASEPAISFKTNNIKEQFKRIYRMSEANEGISCPKDNSEIKNKAIDFS
jgi:hypothetical protein